MQKAGVEIFPAGFFMNVNFTILRVLRKDLFLRR
jgi:hypothetical protein